VNKKKFPPQGEGPSRGGLFRAERSTPRGGREKKKRGKTRGKNYKRGNEGKKGAGEEGRGKKLNELGGRARISYSRGLGGGEKNEKKGMKEGGGSMVQEGRYAGGRG